MPEDAVPYRILESDNKITASVEGDVEPFAKAVRVAYLKSCWVVSVAHDVARESYPPLPITARSRHEARRWVQLMASLYVFGFRKGSGK